MLIDEPLGVGLSQELAHLDGSRLTVLAASKSRVRVSHRAAGGSVPTEIHQNTAERHAEHVRDVFRSSACGAWSCEGRRDAVRRRADPNPHPGSGGGSSAGSL